MKWLLIYAAGFALTFVWPKPNKGDPDDWLAARLVFSALWPVWAQIVVLCWLCVAIGRITPQRP